jgi:hypothetical protein
VDALEVEAPAPTNHQPREPEKLVLPAAGVRELLEVALRTEPGAALWRGFVIAHGEPSWLLARPGQPRAWALRAQDAEVVPSGGTPAPRE